VGAHLQDVSGRIEGARQPLVGWPGCRTSASAWVGPPGWTAKPHTDGQVRSCVHVDLASGVVCCCEWSPTATVATWRSQSAGAHSPVGFRTFLRGPRSISSPSHRYLASPRRPWRRARAHVAGAERSDGARGVSPWCPPSGVAPLTGCAQVLQFVGDDAAMATPQHHLLPLTGPGVCAADLPYVRMSEGKRPEDRCAECDHPRSAHSEYTHPHRSGGSADQPCPCPEFAEPAH
jgi:hypothetical protein